MLEGAITYRSEKQYASQKIGCKA